MKGLKVLYEDNHLIAVFKPAGVLVQPALPRGRADATGDESLMDMTKKYLKEKYDKPGNVFLGLAHRLDRPVSGIVVFAKTTKGASRLSEQFRERETKKTYHALIRGKMEPEKGELVNYLKKDEQRKMAEISDSDKTGDLAELEYETIKSNKKFSLLKINLQTGRFHQIRAQLAHAGHPIAGDIKYGDSKQLPDKSICLSATGLEFTAATGDQPVKLEIAYPDNWDKYFN